MLATKQRVPRQYIDYILKKGNLHSSKFFIIRFRENRQHFCRYRAIVSKKVDPKAVKRNHLRRQIYEAIRTNLPQTEVSGNNLDLILIVKKNALKASFAQIEADIKYLITKPPRPAIREKIINNYKTPHHQ